MHSEIRTFILEAIEERESIRKVDVVSWAYSTFRQPLRETFLMVSEVLGQLEDQGVITRNHARSFELAKN